MKHLPCINFLHLNALLIVELDAPNIGYGKILKQEYNNQVYIVRYHTGIRLGAQINYSTIKNRSLINNFMCFKVSKWFDKKKNSFKN